MSCGRGLKPPRPIGASMPSHASSIRPLRHSSGHSTVCVSVVTVSQRFRSIDGPTWIVAVVLYGSWFLLVWYHALLPWWFILPVGAYLTAWHFSLQHEAIH